MSDAPNVAETPDEDSRADDHPDPSDVEPLGKSDGVYQRDSDGSLTPLPPEVIEWGGDYHRIRFYPTPIGDVEGYRNLGDDVEMDELFEIVAEKVHTPDRTAEQWADTDPEQFNAILAALVERALGEQPTSDFHAEVREEIEARADAGNR